MQANWRRLLTITLFVPLLGCASTAVHQTDGTSGPRDGTGGQTDATGGQTDGTGGVSEGPTGGSSALDPTSGSGNAVTPAAGQQYVFEVTYFFMHWGPALEGIFVTADGTVYAYDYFADASDAGAPYPGFDPLSPPGPVPASELAARYGASPRQIGTIAPEDLQARLASVADAQAGVLLQSIPCRDAGEATFLAWVYDTTNATYSPVILGVDGDVAMRNTAGAAVALVDWLGPLYVTAGGRWATWTDDCRLEATELGAVSDCGECPADNACIADCAGGYHCQKFWFEVECPSGSDPLSCACLGAQVCAAGSAWCRGTPTTGLTCEAP
jgi:hypothetical protein